MEKLYNAVCWIGLGIFLILGLGVLLYRAAVIVWLTVWMALFSSLPWWERILAPAAIVAGMVFLFRRYTGTLGHRIRRSKNFVYYTSRTQEESSSTSAKTEDL
ncbi:MAG TPA: hypothetical protein VN933_08115 [Candidatus Eremiobacteraceae bacterium]|jgi:membrane protein implicated in regulation of membrane protease activity|nr:hypothetical protein [Candidatus Eremiobacteraceae bacterium]